MLSLCIIGTDEALSIIDRCEASPISTSIIIPNYVFFGIRTAMYKFMLDMKDPVTKGIRMHRDGEIDTRSIYTCLVVARILNILTPGFPLIFRLIFDLMLMRCCLRVV